MKTTTIAVLFALAAVVLVVGHAAAFSTSDLEGDYEIECESLAGLDPSWRISERQVLRGDEWVAISTLYSDSNCHTEVLRYDRGFTYKLGGVIDEDDWAGSGARAYRDETRRVVRTHWRKVATPLNGDGAAFLNSLCSTTTFGVGKSVDVFEFDCAPFFFTCRGTAEDEDDEDEQNEHICVHLDEETNELIQCQRSATGSCNEDDEVLDYYPDAAGAPVIARPVVSAVNDATLQGKWKRECSSAIGFPADWRLSTAVEYNDGDYKIVNVWYDSPECQDRIAYFTASGHYTLGLERDNVVADLSRTREQDVFYESKSLWYPKQAAVDYLNSLCPGNNFEANDNHRDLLDVDCAPLFFSCSEWKNSDLGTVSLTINGQGLVTAAGQSVVEIGGQGCAPDDRGFFPLITQEGTIYALAHAGSSASTLAFSAILLLISFIFVF